jgi:hypothetical protein
MAASDRKEQLQSEINLQNALVDSVKTHLFLSEKGRDVKTQLLDKLQEEKELGNQIESIQKAIDDLLLEQIQRGDTVNQTYIEQLDRMREILELKKQQKDKEEEIKDLTKDFKDNLLGSLGTLGDMLKAGTAFGAGMVLAKKASEMITSAFESTVGLAKELYTQTGATAAESARLGAQTMSAMLSMEGLLYGGEALANAAKDASEYYGSTAVITADMQKNITKLSAMGVEGAAQMNSIFQSASGNASELTAEIQAIAQDAGVNASAVLKDMSSNMTAMVGKSKEELKYLAQKTAQLQKQGMSMGLMEDMSSNMLDVESSLRAQMKARQFGLGEMLGDTEKMRNAAMEIQYGDRAQGMEQMAEAMKEAGLTSEQLGNMGVKQIGFLAESYGMTSDQLTEMVTKQEALDKIMKETGVTTTEQAIAIQEQEAAQKAMFNTIKQGAMSSLPLLAQMIGQYFMMKNLSKSVGAAGGGAGGAAGGGSMFSGMTDAIEKIDAKKLIAGGAALVLVAASVFVFGKAVQEFMSVSWEAVGMAVVSMLALVGALALVGTIMMSGVGAVAIIAGAAAMLVIASALFVLGKAIQEIATGFGMMGELTTQLTALVLIAPGLIALAGIFGLLGVGLLAMSVGLAAVTLFLPTLLVLGMMLPLITSALGMGGDGGDKSSVDSTEGSSSDALLQEIKGLRSDIQNQPVQIVIDDKVISTMNKKNSRMQGYRDQMR